MNPALIIPVPVVSRTRGPDIPLAWICPMLVLTVIVPDRPLSRICPTASHTVVPRPRGTVRSKKTPQSREPAG